jgi:hypothetical protein
VPGLKSLYWHIDTLCQRSICTFTVKLEFKESASVCGGLGLVAIETISAAEDGFFKKQMLAVLYPSRVHPARVCNLFILTIVLHEIAKNNYKSTAVPTAPQDFELGLIYKYCMMEVAEDVQTSHGKQISLWNAHNARVIEEAELVTDSRVTIA